MLQKWERKDAYFKKELLSDGKNSWPRDQDPGEPAYRRWLDLVRDPTTKVFYKGHKEEVKSWKTDAEGKQMPDETITAEIEPDYTVTTIIRIKTFTNEEFLVSIGQCTAYSQMGDELVRSYDRPEMWEEVIFGHRMTQDKNGRWQRTTDGPKSIVNHYDLPFTKDAVDVLWEKRDKHIGCHLIVMDENSQEKQTVPSLDLFTQQAFDFLMQRNYLSAEEKLKEKEKFEKEHPELVEPPTTTAKGKK